MKRNIFILFVFCSCVAVAQDYSVLRQIDQLVLSNQYDQALSSINAQLSSVQGADIKVLLNNKKAEVLIAQGKLSDAELLLATLNNTAISDFQKAVTRSTSGFLSLNKGRNDIALEQEQQALALFQKAGKENSKEAAQCLSYLASVYIATGKYNQSRENGLIALQIRQKLFGELSEEVAASYNDLGLAYAVDDGDKALSYYEKALPVYTQMHGNEHPKIAIANSNMGIIYRSQKLYGDAVINFETALEIWKKIYPNGHPNEAFVLFNLGQTYSAMGEFSAAKEYLQKALTIYNQFYGTKHPDIASTENEIGALLLKQEQFDEALQHFQQALIANAPVFTSGDITRNPATGDYYNGNIMLYALSYKARALENKYFGKTLRVSDLKLAVSCLMSGDSLIDNLRQRSQNESDKLALSALATDVYEDGVRIAAALSTVTIDPNTHRKTAFYFMEKSKSAVLQEAIAESDAKSFSGIPANLLEQEKNMKSSLALIARKLAEKPSAEEEKTLRSQLFNENLAYTSFIKTLESSYPDYFNLKFNVTAPSITDVQNILDEKTAVISYFVAERSKRIYLFIITKKQFTLKDLTLPDNLDRLIRGFTNSILYQDIELQKSTSVQLSKLLLPKLPGYVDDLVIISSGRLGTLPFEALLTKKSNSGSYAGLPFFVKKYGISYEFSSGLLIQKSKEKTSPLAPGIFLCAPVSFERNKNLSELPATVTEVNTIANLFAGKAKSTVLYKDANEDLVKSNALSSYSYLHFATHGIVDEDDPELSRIFLNAGVKEDGDLFSGEIYNLDLNAEMVVLSACQTGLGKFSKGEGVIGLSRALVYAGAKNIIVSFWSVADESTAELMVSFYKDLLSTNHQDFREALRDAKLEMIRKGTYSAPYYWAPFVMIGN